MIILGLFLVYIDRGKEGGAAKRVFRPNPNLRAYLTNKKDFGVRNGLGGECKVPDLLYRIHSSSMLDAD